MKTRLLFANMSPAFLTTLYCAFQKHVNSEVLCVSVFQGSLLVTVIMIDGSKKCSCEGGL